MLVGALTLVTAQFFDFGTFVSMLGRHGPAAEANPLVNALLSDMGLPFLFVAKLSVAALAIAVVAVLIAQGRPQAHPRLAGTILAIGIAAGLIGGLSNALTLI
jgi:hypothetical protein